MVHNIILGTLLAAALLAGGCSTSTADAGHLTHEQENRQVLAGAGWQAKLDWKRPPGGLSLDVLHEGVPTEVELRACAEAVYQAWGGRHYGMVSMFHWLPGMKQGAGAYATTHFHPFLEVRLMGAGMLWSNPPTPDVEAQLPPDVRAQLAALRAPSPPDEGLASDEPGLGWGDE